MTDAEAKVIRHGLGLSEAEEVFRMQGEPITGI
jgi:hypothetical protein